MKSVALGDPHVVPSEIEECERLMQLVETVVEDSGAEALTIFGDLHNNHDTVSVRVQDFWRRWLRKIRCKKVLIVGNHDQAHTDRTHPHALSAYADMPDVTVVDSPTRDVLPHVDAMPYFYDPAEFVKAAAELRGKNRGTPALFCHQTFTGARYENGFYAKDAVDPDDVACYDSIWSGHIHTRHSFAQVNYVGAPRWRTLSDANVDRFVYVFEHSYVSSVDELLSGRDPLNNFNVDVTDVVSTAPACRRIWTGEDRPDAPFERPEGYRSTDLLKIAVYGPTLAYVRAREADLRAVYGPVTTGYPDRASAPAGVSRTRGVEASLDSFAATWEPPAGSPRDAVVEEVRRRAR